MKRIVLIIICACLAGILLIPRLVIWTAGNNTQASYMVLDFKGIVRGAQGIVEGTVVGISLPKRANNNSCAEGEKNIICRDVTIRVEKVYKPIAGNPEYICLRILGGTIGRDSMSTVGTKDIHLRKERVLLFLGIRYQDNEDRSDVFKLQRGGYSYWPLNSLNEPVVEVGPKAFMNYDTLEEDVRRILSEVK